MDLGLAALGTKMYPGQPAPGTRGHAENNLTSGGHFLGPNFLWVNFPLGQFSFGSIFPLEGFHFGQFSFGQFSFGSIFPLEGFHLGQIFFGSNYLGQKPGNLDMLGIMETYASAVEQEEIIESNICWTIILWVSFLLG